MTLNADLSSLESSGLIRQASPAPEIEYLFRHALIQDAAYHSLLKADRRTLHLSVGGVLERLYAGRLDEIASTLGHHFAEGGDEARAVRYYTAAGEAALNVYANAEAALHYSRALAIVNASTALRNPAALRSLYTRRGRALELVGDYAGALSNYEALESVGRALADRSLELAALILKATIYSFPTILHDLVQGRQLSERALALARELGDQEAEAKALWNLMLSYKFSGDVPTALACGEQALALARALGLREQVAYILNDMTLVYILSNQRPQAEAVLLEAMGLWRSLGIQNMLADSLASLAGIRAFMGQYDEALALADEAWQISQLIGNPWNQSYTLFSVVPIYIDRGEFGLAIKTATDCIRLAERAGFIAALVETQIHLALAYGRLGQVALGLEVSRVVLEWKQIPPAWQVGPQAVRAYLHFLSGDLAAAQAELPSAAATGEEAIISIPGFFAVLTGAELALARGEARQVLAMLESAIPTLLTLNLQMFFSEVLYLKARALLDLGQTEAAYQALLEARDFAERLQARYVLWQVYGALSALTRRAKRGDELEAQRWRDKARAMIEYIAANAGSAERYDSFMALPAVRAVWEGAARV